MVATGKLARVSPHDGRRISRVGGAERRRLTRGKRSEEIGPIYWAPDGETILYTHSIEKGE